PLQDDLPVPPEQEFTTNVLEHLKANNLRLAVLEAIIGLEIVLTRYLRAFLRAYQGTPEDRINKFLSPDFGLTARLSGVLDLTLNETDRREFDLTKVMTVVSWRNKVTHGEGRLPTAPRDEVADR